jgi:hypothetical protein
MIKNVLVTVIINDTGFERPPQPFAEIPAESLHVGIRTTYPHQVEIHVEQVIQQVGPHFSLADDTDIF